VQTYRPGGSTGDDSPYATRLQIATCSYWLKVLQFLLFQVGFISFASFGKKSLHLPWKANVCKESELKERNWVQGQINSFAVIRKLSAICLVLTHSRRSDLI